MRDAAACACRGLVDITFRPPADTMETANRRLDGNQLPSVPAEVGQLTGLTYLYGTIVVVWLSSHPAHPLLKHHVSLLAGACMGTS